METQARENPHKQFGLLIWIFTVIFAILAAIFASLILYQRTYASKILPRVYLEEIDLSGMTKKQAMFLIANKQKEIENREITIKAGEKTVSLPIKNTGLSLDSEKIAADAYNAGRTDGFMNNLLSTAKTIWQTNKITVTPSINKNQYESFINLIVPQLNIESSNATLTVENGTVTETKETVGQKVKTDNVNQLILGAITKKNDTVVELEIEKIYPEIRIQDTSLARSFANDLLAKKITLTYENFSFTPSASDIGKWINFENNEGRIVASVNDNAIKTYLNQIAVNFEVQKVNKKVNALDGSVITEGQEGKYLDKTKSLEEIKRQLNSNENITLALVTYTEKPTEEKIFPAEGLVPGRYEGKYIDIDLAQQKLCLIEGQNIGDCYIVSSGKASTPTPTGTRYIEGKAARAWSAKYGLWMPWWQSLGGGYGIHELPEWPGGFKEGQDHLGTPVSHGCVRLGIGAAETVYNWAPTGTPVYIHK